MVESVEGLINKVVAVPESRQLDVMAQLLERRGAKVVRVPLVAIHANPDFETVLAWIRGFISSPPEMFIILTGEGIRRLLALAQNHGLYEEFVVSLSNVTKLSRGPKPNRALREIGLRSEIQALEPTTDGIIATLQEMKISPGNIAVQLYGEEPNVKLMNYLSSCGVDISKVAPYVYADDAETVNVLDLIHAVVRGEIDVIAFTSQPQFKRLQQVAKRHELDQVLIIALNKIKVAVVGPLVKEQLEAVGIRVDIMPERAFFMKPLVTAIMKDLSA